jgi:hypothetical protein
MGTFTNLKAELSDLYKKRGVRRVVYFHCDHWEPWRPLPGFTAINQKNADEVMRFVDVMKRIDFGSKQTLFYKDTQTYVYDHDQNTSPGVKVDPGDGIRFNARYPELHDIATKALRYVATQSAMEIQVHIHHENVTFNTAHEKPDVIKFIGSDVARRYEEERFALLLSLSLRSIEEQTGKKLDRWFFVHGHWGLNASDPAVCHLTREIAIMMDHGCLGDFTVPSGRPVVNPRLEVPYFVTPVDAPKGYDLQEAEPEFAYGNKTAKDRGKFLIWSSIIKHRGASLDYYAPWLRKRLDELDKLSREIVEQSFLVDGTLFIKSHAHSMHPQYYEDTRLAVFPHSYPPIQNLFSVLFDAAASAGAEVSFLGASEVYDLLINADYQPPDGFPLTIPGDPPVIDGCLPAERRFPLKTAITQLKGQPKAGPGSKAGAGSLAKAAPQAVAKALQDVETINGIARTIVLDRIATLGEAGSGAGNYYKQRAQSPDFFAPYEIKLAEYLVANAKHDAYHEIGCGFGALPILLAANGLPCLGIDSDRKRIDGSQSILLEVSRKLGSEKRRLAAGCEFIQGTFPAITSGRDTLKSLAFFTNITSTITPEQRRNILEGLKSYSTVILDLQRFLERRSSAIEEDALAAELAGIGLGKPIEILNLGNAGRYVRFDRA